MHINHGRAVCVHHIPTAISATSARFTLPEIVSPWLNSIPVAPEQYYRRLAYDHDEENQRGR